MDFRISLSVSVKKPTGILIGIALTLDQFEEFWYLNNSLLICKHKIFLCSFRS